MGASVSLMKFEKPLITWEEYWEKHKRKNHYTNEYNNLFDRCNYNLNLFYVFCVGNETREET